MNEQASSGSGGKRETRFSMWEYAAKFRRGSPGGSKANGADSMQAFMSQALKRWATSR